MRTFHWPITWHRLTALQVRLHSIEIHTPTGHREVEYDEEANAADLAHHVVKRAHEALLENGRCLTVRRQGELRDPEIIAYSVL